MLKLASFSKKIIIVASILAAIAIALGAFGAHGLKEVLSTDQLGNFQTGVRYQFYHVFALLFTALLSAYLPNTDFRWVTRFFLIGIACFSGSLYLLSTASIHSIPVGILGPITPLGGLMFILGWVALVVKLVRSQANEGLE